MSEESRNSSSDSNEQTEASGAKVRTNRKIMNCLRTYGPTIVEVDEANQHKNGWMTQNEVFRQLKLDGEIPEDTQVSSVNPQFAHLEEQGKVIQMPDKPGDRLFNRRYDPFTRRNCTLWKAAPEGTEPKVAEKKCFFIVDAGTRETYGPFTKEYCEDQLISLREAMKNEDGDRRLLKIKVGGSKRYNMKVD